MSAAERRGSRIGAATVRFTFDGRAYRGQAGDTAASALLANGVRLLGRSVKYRRPRGVLAAGPEDPNALLTVAAAGDVIPNVAAAQLVLRDGLALTSQNRWPTLAFDLASLLRVGSGFFAAGFYYKTFIWPSWRSYEPLIRALAGLGRAPRACDLPPVATEHVGCDVLVAGGGPAGLAAALAAARAGAHVVLCEREPVCGGELEFEGGMIETRAAADWIAATLAELRARGARVLTDTAVVGGSDGQVIAHAEPGGLPGHNTVYRIRPRAFIAAMGAVERPIAFVDNDRPGVMLLGAAERFLARYGARAGRELVLFANHDRAYAAATRLAAGGMRLCAIVDSRTEAEFGAASGAARLRDGLMGAGTECLLGHAVLAADGGHGVRAVQVAPLAAPRSFRRIACDALLVSGGWTPALHAGLNGGGSPRYAPALGAFVASEPPDWRASAGACNGELELAAVLADGYAAGAAAARRAGAGGEAGAAPSGVGDDPPRLERFWRSPARRACERRQFVDLQNDVTVADLRSALAEGFRDIEHIKRYTTLGVGTEQGRTSGLLGAAIVAELQGGTLGAVGTSRSRVPIHPVTLRSLVGDRIDAALRPTRRTPLHDWHVANGAILAAMGLWMRPRYYRASGPDGASAASAEALRVRTTGGIVDGSTLGKIEIAGADAAAFLDRMYLTRASTIKVGRSRYMVNLREDGMVLDDGIVMRLAPDRFLATTGSGHATHVQSHFEHYRDTEWSGHAVTLTDVTEAWAVIVVAGPRSRDVLDAVLGAEWRPALARLTHMDFAPGHFCSGKLTVLRASFSGELAFELHCRPPIALPLWEALNGAGLPPYGLDALDILRLEKGYLVGAELNGETTPMDLGVGVGSPGNPCVGRDLLDRPAFHEPARRRLVGIRACDGRARFLGGAQLVSNDAPTVPCGYVTSSAYSPTLGEWVGLGLVARRIPAEGTELIARDPLRGAETAVRLVAPVHVDPAGTRMKS